MIIMCVKIANTLKRNQYFFQHADKNIIVVFVCRNEKSKK